MTDTELRLGPGTSSDGGSAVIAKDEGSTVVAAATALDFVGAGVTVTDGGSGTATVTIPTQLTTEQVQDIAGALIAQGSGVTVTYDDAANTLTIASPLAVAALPKGGGTMTGAIVLAGDPAAALEATPRQYVLAQITAAIDALIDSAPGTLNTLNEIALQLATDESAVGALTTSVAGKVAKATYDANSILKADTDDTPVVLPMAASTILARLASGAIKAASTAEIATLLSAVLIPAPASPTDAYVLTWNNTLGAWVATAPTGNSQLAYAENNTSTTQAGINNTTVDVTGCTIVVPVSSRPVYIGGHLYASITAGNGTAVAGSVSIVETSNGIDTPVSLAGNAQGTGTGAQLHAIPATRLATSTANIRTFKLRFTAGAAPTYTINNGTSNMRSVIWAEAR